MFRCLYHPGRVGTRCLNLIKLNGYPFVRISECSRQTFLFEFHHVLVSKDLLASILDNSIIGIAIILFVLPFIGHIVDVSDKPLFEGGGNQN